MEEARNLSNLLGVISLSVILTGGIGTLFYLACQPFIKNIKNSKIEIYSNNSNDLIHLIFSMETHLGNLATDRVIKCAKGCDYEKCLGNSIEKIKIEISSHLSSHLLAVCPDYKFEEVIEVLENVYRIPYVSIDGLKDSQGRAHYDTMNKKSGLGSLISMNTLCPMSDEELSRLHGETERLSDVYFFLDGLNFLNQRREKIYNLKK